LHRQAHQRQEEIDEDVSSHLNRIVAG